MPQVGQVIGGKYRLERLLGAGGMGAVFEAVHVHIGSKVAIKFLHPGLTENAEAVQRFQREAQAAAAVGHDAIISIHDIGETEGGESYLVMEHLRGKSLGDAIYEERGLSLQELVYIACQVLSGLSAAHAAGIVHRDLKPDNIYLVDTGALLPGVKLLDFGISRITGLGANDKEYTRLTQTGIVLGTPAYMSPEHARGLSDIDARSDIFSVGIILYECLTGTIPFDGPNYNAVLASVLTEDPPSLRELRPDLPSSLVEAITKALEKDREARYQSALPMFGELLPLLDEWVVGRVVLPVGMDFPQPRLEDTPLRDTVPQSTPFSPAPVRRKRRAGLVFAALLVAMLLLGLGAGLTLYEGPPATPGVAASSSGPDRGTAVAPPVEVPVEAAVVTIELVGLPQGARVVLDGAEVPTLPLRLHRGGPMRELLIEAEGYDAYRRVIAPVADQRLEVELRATARPVAGLTTATDAAPPRSLRDHSSRQTKHPPPTKQPAKQPDYRPAFLGPPPPVYRPDFIE